MDYKHPSREDSALVLALLRSSQLFVRSIGPVLHHAGLTTSQWDVLEALHTKGGLTINELMDVILTTSGNLDVVVKNLMSAGFLEKTVNEHDRRSRIVRLTELGENKFNSVLPVHNQALAEIFSGLTHKDKREAIRILSYLKKQLTRNRRGDDA